MYYTDTRKTIGAMHGIPAHILRDIPEEGRAKLFAHVAYGLSSTLRDAATKEAEALKWERYLFVEVMPHEWPDMPDEAARAMSYALDPTFAVRAHGYIFERLPDWSVRVMHKSPNASPIIGILRPVATLSGERGLAIAGDGTIFFWPDRTLHDTPRA